LLACAAKEAAQLIFGRPRGMRAGPGGERVPFGPSHAALFVADFDKNKRGVVLPGLRSGECQRYKVRELCQQLNAERDSDEERRRQLCRQIFGKGGDSVWMQPPFFCDYGSNIELGERVFFNFNCVVLDVCRVRIGDFSLFGPGVQLLTPVHPFNAALRRKEEYGRPIDIGSDVWVGAGALVLPGVSIGSSAVIGAGSVVTRDIPEGVFAAGNPCRVVREISENDRAEDAPYRGSSR